MEETAPVDTKPVEQPIETPAAATADETTAADATPKPETTETPAAATEEVKPEETKKDEAVVEATPASEGVLGYKAPGFLK